MVPINELASFCHSERSEESSSATAHGYPSGFFTAFRMTNHVFISKRTNYTVAIQLDCFPAAHSAAPRNDRIPKQPLNRGAGRVFRFGWIFRDQQTYAPVWGIFRQGFVRLINGCAIV